MSSSRSRRCTPVPLVLLAALVAVLVLLLGGSPAVADRHGSPGRDPVPGDQPLPGYTITNPTLAPLTIDGPEQAPPASGCGGTRAHRRRRERPARKHADLHRVCRHGLRGVQFPLRLHGCRNWMRPQRVRKTTGCGQRHSTQPTLVVPVSRVCARSRAWQGPRLRRSASTTGTLTGRFARLVARAAPSSRGSNERAVAVAGVGFVAGMNRPASGNR
jgi:hypothetical protein